MVITAKYPMIQKVPAMASVMFDMVYYLVLDFKDELIVSLEKYYFSWRELLLNLGNNRKIWVPVVTI